MLKQIIDRRLFGSKKERQKRNEKIERIKFNYDVYKNKLCEYELFVKAIADDTIIILPGFFSEYYENMDDITLINKMRTRYDI